METKPKRLPFQWLFRWKFWRTLLLVIAGLITLIALYHAEENWRGKRAWENYKQAREAHGEVFDFAKLVPPPVPADQNFATTPFLAGVFDFVPGTQRQRDSNTMPRINAITQLPNEAQSSINKALWQECKPLEIVGFANDLLASNSTTPPRFSPGQTQEAAQAILDKLKPTESVLDELRSTSKRPYSRFNISYDYEPKFGILLPHLGTINGICSILELKALSKLELGRKDDASQDIEMTMRLSQSLRTEPIIISQLVHAACLAKALAPLWEGLARHQWSDAQLAKFSRQLQEFNFIADGQMAFNAEKCFCDSFFVQIRHSSNPMHEVAQVVDGSPDPGAPGEILGFLVPAGWFYFEELNYHQLFDEQFDGVFQGNEVNSELANNKAAEVQAKLGSGGWAILHHQAFARMLLPSLKNAEYKMARAQTYTDLAMIACGLERFRMAHGQFPENLDALAPEFLPKVPSDVIMGQALKYRKTSDGQFLLYSIGWNSKDDGGAAVKESQDMTNGDWVWEYPGEAVAR